MTRTFATLLVLLLSLSPRMARAEPTREFIMSSTYGVLAGCLVGAATLAFTDKPGDNLKNIARGASFGLYAGIFLGLYVIYGVPSGSVPPMEEGPSTNPEEYPEGNSEDLPPGVRNCPAIYPLISDKGIDGAGLAYKFSF